MPRRWTVAAFIVAGFVAMLPSQAFAADPQRLALARKACTGDVLQKNQMVSTPGWITPLKYDSPPILYFRESYVQGHRPSPFPVLLISTRYCPAPGDDAVYIVGQYLEPIGEARYYKISLQGGGILEAASSYYDRAKDDLVYEAIAPISQTGSVKIYSEAVQQDFNALMALVIAKWGH